MTRLILSITLLLLTSHQEFKAKVIRITDWDTIVVLTSDNQQIKIRLEGIDCPESKQDFGQKAKQATADLCFGKDVIIQETGKDRYGRTLAFIYAGVLCVNKELIRLGMQLISEAG